MPFYLAVYDWSLYTTPAALSTARLEGDTQPNNPANPGYDPDEASWLGETFTFNGGASTQLAVNDDDGNFEDGYVETGGAATLAQDVTINGTTYLAGSVVENEFSMLDSSGNEIWVVRIDGVNVGFAYPEGLEPSSGETFIGVTGRDGDGASSDDGIGSSEPYSLLVCFTNGAMIATPDGPRPVEMLRTGDTVSTVDCGPQPIIWTSSLQVRFRGDPNDAKPVLVKKGAFASCFPTRDLVVSPQHRFVFHDQRGGQSKEVLVAAKALTCLPGIRSMNGKRTVEYRHFALRRHSVVVADGVHTESCYIGPSVLAGASELDCRRLKQQFPDLLSGRGYGPTARPVIKVQEARRLLISKELTFEQASTRQNHCILDSVPA